MFCVFGYLWCYNGIGGGGIFIIGYYEVYYMYFKSVIGVGLWIKKYV